MTAIERGEGVMRDFVLKAPGVEPSECPRACDVMTAPAVACRDEAFFEEVAEILADRDISGMPVVDAAGTIVGVISERDLAYALGGARWFASHSDATMSVLYPGSRSYHAAPAERKTS